MTSKATKTGRALERRVTDAYRQIGARKVEHDVELAGNQVDVYVELETPGCLLHRIAVEAKDWSKPVGIDVVNGFALIAGLLRSRGLIDEGIIVSASGFSKQARNAAKVHGIRLLEPIDLETMTTGTRISEHTQPATPPSLLRPTPSDVQPEPGATQAADNPLSGACEGPDPLASPSETPAQAQTVSVHQYRDSYSPYETGLRQLLERLGLEHPVSSQALVYQQRLSENIAQSRTYGDTRTRKADRAEVIDRLNAIALSVLDVSFSQLCDLSPSTEGGDPSERSQTCRVESLDARILKILHNHLQAYPGDPEMNLNELIGALRADRADIVQCLFELREKGWLDYNLLDQAQSGLVRLTRLGAKVARDICRS